MHGEHGERWSIYQCGYADLAAVLGAAGVKADALIVDAPYSAKTHAGHETNEGDESPDGFVRRPIEYAAWSPADVLKFVHTMAETTEGWWASLTDDVLSPAWRSAFDDLVGYGFAPLPCVESGSRVRLSGDGPPSWSTWLTVGRPTSIPWRRWAVRVDREKRGARPLPGYYLGKRERKPIVGGKPLWLMREIVGDYSAPGALVLDPCAGGGTTLVAAIQIGRRAIGCEPDAGRFNIAVERLRAAEKEITT